MVTSSSRPAQAGITPPRPFQIAVDDRGRVGAVEPDRRRSGWARRARGCPCRPRRDRRRNCRRRPSCPRRGRPWRRLEGRRASARSPRPSSISARLSMPSRPKAGIGGPCRLSAAGADAVTDGLRDLVELAAPQPVVVVEIGIALGAAAAGAVARRAILGEGGPRLRAREVEQLRVGRDLLQRRRGQSARPSARAAPSARRDRTRPRRASASRTRRWCRRRRAARTDRRSSSRSTRRSWRRTATATSAAAACSARGCRPSRGRWWRCR